MVVIGAVRRVAAPPPLTPTRLITDRKNEKGPAIFHFHLHAELTNDVSRVPTKVASIWDNL